ncbi:MAG: GC-type dockerin domain-anchored protein [Planctomycetota bacterium]
MHETTKAIGAGCVRRGRVGLSVAAGAVGVAVSAPVCSAQFNPAFGQWGKSDGRDLRVVTYNIEDALCSTNPRKSTVGGDWDALARTIAALEPDVVLLQECGDNSGNGSGSGGDTAGELTAVMELFIEGGADPFLGGTVTSYVQAYNPELDYFVFVSQRTDGVNRNVILSRFPFVDLNGDGRSAISDVFFTEADAFNTVNGNGEVRGTQIAEIDLPDATFAGDLVVANSHFKAGRTSNDFLRRRNAAQVVAYNIYYWLGGAGTGTPDPNGKVADVPAATSVLGPDDVVIFGGDWNDDDGLLMDPAAPLLYMLTGGAGVNDGTDRDGTDSAFDGATDFFTGLNGTLGSRKIDYLAYWDSVASVRRAHVFNAASFPDPAAVPAAFDGFPSVQNATVIAADHRAVFADFEIPLRPEVSCFADFSLEGTCGVAGGDGVTLSDFACYLSLWSFGAARADITLTGSCDVVSGGGDGVDLSDFSCYLSEWSKPCP